MPFLKQALRRKIAACLDVEEKAITDDVMGKFRKALAQRRLPADKVGWANVINGQDGRYLFVKVVVNQTQTEYTTSHVRVFPKPDGSWFVEVVRVETQPHAQGTRWAARAAN